MKAKRPQMVRAFHWVPSEAFPKVLKQGYLTPAVERLSPGFFREKCADDSRSFQERGLNYAVSVEAVERLVEERISDLSKWSHGGFSRGEFSQLGCIDLLARDHENVFLQVAQWVEWGSGEKPTGFVFDAADLIRQGAVLREKDLAPLYWGALYRFLRNDWGDIDRAQDELMEMFADIQEAHELRGKEAIAALRKLDRRAIPSELLWNGRLPVSLAIESFNPDLYLEA